MGFIIKIVIYRSFSLCDVLISYKCLDGVGFQPRSQISGPEVNCGAGAGFQPRPRVSVPEAYGGGGVGYALAVR